MPAYGLNIFYFFSVPSAPILGCKAPLVLCGYLLVAAGGPDGDAALVVQNNVAIILNDKSSRVVA